MENARARLAAAEHAQRLAVAELQAANSDLLIWNNAYMLALKEKEKWQAGAKEMQPVLPMELPEAAAETVAETLEAPADEAHAPEVNKTEKVRDALREHATGITPAQLWVEVKDFQVSRPYLYSVLKRLRDNDEVSVRRGGKYILKPKPTELEELTGTVIQ